MMSNAYSIAGSESIRRAKMGPKWTLCNRPETVAVIPHNATHIELAQRDPTGTYAYRYRVNPRMEHVRLPANVRAWRFV